MGESILWMTMNYRVGDEGFLVGEEMQNDRSTNSGEARVSCKSWTAVIAIDDDDLYHTC